MGIGRHFAAGLLTAPLLFCSLARASVSHDFVRSFQTPKILFPSEESDFMTINPGRYPGWMMTLFQDLLAWTPTGQKSNYSEGCRPEDLTRSMMESGDAKHQAQVIEEHKNRCQKSFENTRFLGPINTLKMMSMKFDVHQHALIHPIVFKLPGSVKLKGLLALKGDFKKRPFVIMRLGVFSNVEEFLPERYLLMQLFEQGLANVLVLENTTGADYIANNQRWSMGGYDEGLQNLQVVKMLRSSASPLSQLISSVHLMGISLGGHGVLFASLLNEYNGKIDKRPIQSFTAICPVVNLKETMEVLKAPGIKGLVVDHWASLRLAGLTNKIPRILDMDWSETLKLEPVFLPKAINYLLKMYAEFPPQRGNVELPPELEQVKDFWGVNNFWPLYRNNKSSVLVMATVDDHLVPLEKNFNWLKNNSKSWQSDLGTVLFEKGYHCTLPVSYDWSTVAAMLNARVMSKDKNTRLKLREVVLDISEQVTPENAHQIKDPIFDLSWPSASEVLVEFKSSLGKVIFTVLLPVKELDFTFRDSLQKPEKASVERWLNQNLQVKVDVAGNKIMAKIQWPSVL